MQEVEKEESLKLNKKHRGKYKSMLIRVINKKDKPAIPLFIAAIILAIIIDIFKIIRKTLKILLIICIIACIIVSIIAYNKIYPIYKEYNIFAENVINNSTEEDFRLSESSYIYYSDGTLMAKLKADKDSNYLEFDEIPAYVIDAFVAVEDRSFWDNPGIDIKGLARVAIDMIATRGEEVHGASTITQQLARNIYLSHEVSLERKAKEMLIALKLTEKYSKHDIMEFYVNDICFGNAFYGIEAASKGYFNKSVKELSLSQIAYLCSIPNSPEYYNPYKNPDRAVIRRDKILSDMLELNYITKEEYDEAVAEEIIITPPNAELNNYETTYAIDCAVEYLMYQNGFNFNYSFNTIQQYKEYKEQYNIAYNEAKIKLYQGGYCINTTIDRLSQKAIQRTLDEKLSFDNEINENTGVYELQGAITVVDNETNKVIAIVGGRSQDNDKGYSLNRAFQSTRQPGSSIKPLVVYTPALELGYTPNSIIKNISIPEAKIAGSNLSMLNGNPVTMRYALEQSLNGVAWYLFNEITPEYGMNKLVDMQFSSIVPDDYFQASSLGGLTYGVTTVEMANAYATLANHGFYTKTTCIQEIIDKDGNNIFIEYSSKQVYSQRASDTIIDMMQGVLTRGTASKLKWSSISDVEAACKTGTTNDSKDGWLCGMTPQYSIAVWVGYDTPKSLPDLYGNTYPGQIWKDAMMIVLNWDNYGVFTKGDYNNDINDYYSSHENYYKYMPDRDDNELISDNYTVRDYRIARIIGESIDKEINTLKKYNVYSPNYLDLINNQSAVIQSIIDSIYGNTFKSQKQNEFNQAYNECITMYNSIANPVQENYEDEY